MKILYFSRDYTPHDHRFLSALVNTGHQIAYLRLENCGRILEERTLPQGVESLAWVWGDYPVRFLDGLRLLADLKRVIRAYQPDIIHAGPLQTSAFLVALAGFQPLVSMSWGYDLLFDAERNFWWRWATQYALKHSAVMVGDCATIRQKAIACGMPDKRIVTFPWGIDINYFRPFSPGFQSSSLCSHLGWGKETFVIISTRNWSPMYGVEELARAFVYTAHQRPELRLLMLGDGPQAALIRQIFTEGGVLNRVHFPGQVKQPDLPDYYRAANLYISTSHSDGTSISLLEAMACGCPVLVSDIPGNREWVVESETNPVGWLFPDGDIPALAEAISRCVEQRERLSETGKAARLLVEQRGDWAKNFPRLLQAYEMAIGVL